MKQTRKEYYRKNRYKRINHLLLGGALTVSLFGVSYMSGSTYALLTDTALMQNGYGQASWVFPSTLSKIKSNLPDIYRNDKSSPNMSENALQGFEQKIRDVASEITPYYDRAQRELNNLNTTLQIFQSHMNNLNQVDNISNSEYETATNTVQEYFKNLYGPINVYSISESQKYFDLLNALRKGEINSYSFVLYIEQQRTNNQPMEEYLRSYLNSFEEQVHNAQRIYGFVSDSYQGFLTESKLLQDKIDQIRKDIEEERLKKEKEEKEKKEKEEKEQKDKEQADNKKDEMVDQDPTNSQSTDNESTQSSTGNDSNNEEVQSEKESIKADHQVKINSNEEEKPSNEVNDEDHK